MIHDSGREDFNAKMGSRHHLLKSRAQQNGVTLPNSPLHITKLIINSFNTIHVPKIYLPLTIEQNIHSHAVNFKSSLIKYLLKNTNSRFFRVLKYFHMRLYKY